MTESVAIESAAEEKTLETRTVHQRPGLHPVVRKSLGNNKRYLTPRGTQVVLTQHQGQPVFFAVNNRQDRIHNGQFKGRFYEQNVLEIIGEHFPEGGVFADIGANIGNHSLYMAKFARASRILPVEPNPAAITLYCAAMLLNGLEDVVAFEMLGYGAGERDASGFSVHDPKGNLGWARLRDTGGDVEVRACDTLFKDEPRIDLIKIDVEGMEIAALTGLGKTLARHRPVLFVEVDHKNRDAFDRLKDEFNYRTEVSLPRNRMNQNFLLLPKERP